MKIELKSIHHSETLSEETNAFTAKVYIDGKFAAYARNDGRGEETNIQPKDHMDWDLIKQAEQYCKTLPPGTYEFGGEQHAYSMTLESVVDDLLEQHLSKKHQQKFDRKLAKAMESGIVFGTLEANSLSVIGFKMPIATLLTYPHGSDTIKQAIERNITGQFKEGEKILNTNIPEKILREAGLMENQYTHLKAPVLRQAKERGRKRKL
ncbi:hypothetical protein [Chitinophaga barathri]|uniref:Uncharacterized protein n=1 Tax=Chitinophaga barathri TaxID=1647451 RepID=A0A3N4MTT7_9BACT|nr:hypothetical protein [Chitinophaga barathri]RPD42959.1 hypothetical protein EG028_01315 [Chitinophaga barathri]